MGRRFRSTHTARRLKTPAPHADTGEEIKLRKADSSAGGAISAGVQGSLGEKNGNIQVRGSAPVKVGCKSILKIYIFI